MRDPHVVALNYGLDTADTVSFDRPAPVEVETDAYRLRLADGIAVFEPKDHFPSVEAARTLADPLFRAWELDAALRAGRQEMTFTYQDAVIVDRDPPPPGTSQVIEVAGAGTVTSSGSVTLHVTRRIYPPPPVHFQAHPDVETLWHRFEGYLKGREPLLAMAYFCLSLLESNAGGREEASQSTRISKTVLRKLGELASIRGDAATARKLGPGSSRAPLTGAEVAWIEAAIKAIIRRVGEIATNPSLPEITLSDLPPL